MQRRAKLSQDKSQESCSPVDLRSNIIGTARHQDSVGWCYAFTAADLISHRLKKKVSALDLALSYNDTWLNDLALFAGVYRGETDIRGGFTEDALEKGLKRGLCLESSMPSSDFALSELKELIEQIEKRQERKKEDWCKQDFVLLQQLFPSLSEKEMQKISDFGFKSTYIDALRKRACKDRINMKNRPEVLNRYQLILSKKPELLQIIDSALERGDLAGISYYANVLTKFDVEEDRDPHASSIVARRFNVQTQSCEYLVRNSWGRSCEYYDKRLKCEEGHIWLPKHILARKAYGVVTLK